MLLNCVRILCEIHCDTMICMQFIETPEYNPEAMMFGAVPTDYDYGSKHFQSTRNAPYTFPAV